jgi:putative superfamily III holin-X
MSAPTQEHERTIPTTPLNQRSLGELVATLSRDLALLVHQEIELVKTELKTGLMKGAAAAGGFVAALVFMLLAAPIVSIAAALGIHALGISLGWSFLIVGGAYVVIGMFAAAFGVMALRRVSKHKRAVESVKADIHAIARKPRPAPPVER